MPSNFPANSRPGCLSERDIKGQHGERRHFSHGTQESLHVQVLAGDAARGWLTLTATGCDQGDKEKAALCHGRNTQVGFQRKAQSSRISLFVPMSVLMFDIQT